jgi:hypothetical protein
MSVSVRLDPDQLEELAGLIAERLRPSERPDAGAELLTAAELAKALCVSRQTIYERAAELGGERVGSGPKARWRFSLERARAAMACFASERSQTPAAGADGSSGAGSATAPRRRVTAGPRRLPNGLPKPGSVLRARPRKAAV